MFKQKLFSLTASVIIILLTLACVKTNNNIKQPKLVYLDKEANLSDNTSSEGAIIAPTKEPNHKVLDKEIINTIFLKKEELNLCDGAFQEDFLKEFSTVYIIDSQRKLIEINCYSGAYQGAFQYFLVNFNNDIKPLYLPIFTYNYETQEIVKNEENFLTGFPQYDETQQTLFTFTKYIGPGGCGYIAKYQWQEDRFELLEFKANFDCLNPTLEENWPVIK